MKYLPRPGGYCDITTGEPVTVIEHGPHCDHRQATWFSFMDRTSADLDVFEGTCCTACGRIMPPGAVKRV